MLLLLLLQPHQTPPAEDVLAGNKVCKLPGRPASVGAGGTPVVILVLLLLLLLLLLLQLFFYYLGEVMT